MAAAGSSRQVVAATAAALFRLVCNEDTGENEDEVLAPLDRFQHEGGEQGPGGLVAGLAVAYDRTRKLANHVKHGSRRGGGSGKKNVVLEEVVLEAAPFFPSEARIEDGGEKVLAWEDGPETAAESSRMDNESEDGASLLSVATFDHFEAGIDEINSHAHLPQAWTGVQKAQFAKLVGDLAAARDRCSLPPG